MKIFDKIVYQSCAPDNKNLIWFTGTDLLHCINGKWESIFEHNADKEELEEKVDTLDKEVGVIQNDLLKFGSKQGVVELQIGNTTAIKSSNLKLLQGIQSTDHTFFTDIDYGYGTGAWLPATGGSATIFTKDGHAVYYTITSDGSVTKAGELILDQKATTTTNGLMTKEDKTKLDSLILIPSGGTTGQVLKKTDSGVAWQNDTDTKYTLPAATTTALGGVKQIAAPAELAESAELAAIISKVNGVINSLISSGVFKGA